MPPAQNEPLALLKDQSETERLVRAFDWSRTSMGRIEAWPVETKSTVSLLLRSTLPIVTLWGEDGVMIYNDAYSRFAGGRHPQLLGSRVREGWPEVADFNDHVMRVGLGGGTLTFKDQQLWLNRHGELQPAWMDLHYSPICDAQGKPVGVIAHVVETTERVLASRALDLSNQQLRSVTDGLPVLIADFDRDRRVRFVNRFFETWFERPAESILGLKPEELVDDAEYAVFRDAFERVLAGHDTTLELPVPSAQGPRDCEIRLLSRRSRDGAVEGMTLLAIDRSERKAAEQALRRSEERYRVINEAMPGFTFTARENGELDYISPRWEQYTGSPSTMSTGWSWRPFLHPDDVEAATQAWVRSVQSGALYEFEYRLRNADGHYRWWLTRAVASKRPDGSIEHWIGVVTDIDQIVAARETLARSNEELEREIERRTRERDRVWNHSRDLILVARDDGVLRAVSPAWTAVLGHDRTEVVGRNFREFMHPDDISGTDTMFANVREQPATNYENRYLHKDGTPRWISWLSASDQDTIYAYGRDITDQKEAEAELAAAQAALRHSQKLEAVGHLTGGLAHDFNNLLAGISGALELTERRIAQNRIGEVAPLIETAQKSAQRAAALTQRLLAFARRQTLDPRPVDANRLVRDMDELLRRTMGPDVSVRIIAADTLWSTRVDAPQLENALLNLCINARDAMAPRGGTLTIESANLVLDARAALERELAPGHYVTLSVTDTGSGMSPEIVAQAFDPFFTTKPLGQGTGLGLSMVYGFARQSGGQVAIESRPGQGTTIRLYLRRHAGQTQPAEHEVAPSDAPQATGETVLLVDDEDAIRSVTAEILRDAGYHVMEAATGPAGLDVLNTPGRIDLLVSDVGLPGGMNGRQMADAARVARPDLKVLFITGYAENAVLGQGGLDSRMQVLTKPFSLVALTARVRTLIDA